MIHCHSFFFFNDTATTEIYTLSYTTLFRSQISLWAPVESFEHAVHAVDFGGLVGVHVGGEPVHDLLFAPALRAEQLVHHGDGTLVVLDHELEEQPVELGTPRAVELRQLVEGQHAGHHRRLHARHRVVSGVRLGHGFMPVPEPAPHEDDLVALAY